VLPLPGAAKDSCCAITPSCTLALSAWSPSWKFVVFDSSTSPRSSKFCSVRAATLKLCAEPVSE
jgi:hypothetical protein